MCIWLKSQKSLILGFHSLTESLENLNICIKCFFLSFGNLNTEFKANLVVGVHLAAAEKDEDVWQQVVAQGPEPRKRRHGSCAHRGALQQHAVVNEPDVP